MSRLTDERAIAEIGNKAMIGAGPVLSIVAGWRESGGLGHLCGGENFWGRVEKSKIFTFSMNIRDICSFFQKIQNFHFKISQIVVVWAKIMAIF